MPSKPTIARVWCERTTSNKADAYGTYKYEAGIRPLIVRAMGVQTFREDRETDTEFVTISYWADIAAMSAFTGRDPAAIHHIDRDEEFLIEQPERVQILHIWHSHGRRGPEQGD